MLKVIILFLILSKKILIITDFGEIDYYEVRPIVGNNMIVATC